MYKLAYGLILWLFITNCMGQTGSNDYSFSLATGISGQFFLVRATTSVPVMFGPSSSTYTSVGLGVPLALAVNFGQWAIELSPTLRYPKTKKWLVQRNGVITEDERSLIIDVNLSFTKAFRHNGFLKNSRYGLGISFLNVNGNISGSYDILTNSGWTQVNYSNMRMLGPHLLFAHNITRKLSVFAMLIYIDGSQVKNKPNISFYLLGNAGLRYLIFGSTKE